MTAHHSVGASLEVRISSTDVAITGAKNLKLSFTRDHAETQNLGTTSLHKTRIASWADCSITGQFQWIKTDNGQTEMNDSRGDGIERYYTYTTADGATLEGYFFVSQWDWTSDADGPVEMVDFTLVPQDAELSYTEGA